MRLIIETCRHCQSQDLQWEKEPGWFTGAWRYLRERCQAFVRMRVPAATWAFYGIALAAAVWGG